MWWPTEKAPENQLLTESFGVPYRLQSGSKSCGAVAKDIPSGGPTNALSRASTAICAPDPPFQNREDPKILPAPESTGYPSGTEWHIYRTFRRFLPLVVGVDGRCFCFQWLDFQRVVAPHVRLPVIRPFFVLNRGFFFRARISGRSGGGLAATPANTDWRPLETTFPDHAPEARGGTAKPCATVDPRRARSGLTYSEGIKVLQ